MVKKALVVLFMASVFVSCNKQMERALKSTDKDFILETADEFYNQGKWTNALELYSKITFSF